MITVKGIEDKYSIELCKTNETPIGALPSDCLDSLTCKLCDLDEAKLTVHKYYYSNIDKIKLGFYLYDEIKPERIITLNNRKFIIKSVEEDDKNKIKILLCYAKQKKLEKNTISVEDLGFYLMDSDEDQGIFNLDEYMYEETGWRFGHIDNEVRYNSNGEPRLRWQESVEEDWYTYLNSTLAKQYNCITVFDDEHGLVNLYAIDNFGDDLKIFLSYDNYLKELSRTDNSSDIVTKLKLIGNEEKCYIEDANPTGLNYIENYSYFIESGDMSNELITALDTYDKMVKERTITWKELNTQLLEKQNELTIKKNEEYMAIENYKAQKKSYDYYASKVGTSEDSTGAYTSLAEQLAPIVAQYKEDVERLYLEVKNLEEDIANLNASIKQINILCRKPTATDSNGNLIFNQQLLDELKLFIYSDTYADDSFYDAEEMLEVGKRNLELSCKPTVSWNISVADFTARLRIPNRVKWNGTLGLGDVIGLYDTETGEETFVYVIEYTKDFKSKSLSLTLSNKKGNENAFKVVNDLLKQGKLAIKQLSKINWISNDIKYNRWNM